MATKPCTCKSYNWDGTDDGAVILDLPDGIDPERNGRSVCVDACIADVIKLLWDSGIQTRGSCCGHNRQAPSVVVAEEHSLDDLDRIRGIIAAVDDRQWSLLQWQLVDIPSNASSGLVVVTQAEFDKSMGAIQTLRGQVEHLQAVLSGETIQ